MHTQRAQRATRIMRIKITVELGSVKPFELDSHTTECQGAKARLPLSKHTQLGSISSAKERTQRN